MLEFRVSDPFLNDTKISRVVPDTQRWEQQAAYFIDTHPRVESFATNAGLGFSIPYTDAGERHDDVPDFLLRLSGGLHLIFETKGFDPKMEVKRTAAERWVHAVNRHGGFGAWRYCLCRDPARTRELIDALQQDALDMRADAR